MGALAKPQLLFYQKLGELFYSIAAAHKLVTKTEFEALKKIVDGQWKNTGNYKDSFHTDGAHKFEVVFDWFDYEQLDANDCFESFVNYKKEYPHLFTKDGNQLIWKTANAIAGSFSEKNEGELGILAKLKYLLKD